MGIARIVSPTRAVYDHLTGDAPLMTLITGGIHDTLAAASASYPYLVFSIGGLANRSTFQGPATAWFRLQTDLYDEGQSAVRIGECSKRLNEVLDRPVIVDASGDYWDFRLKAGVARRFKEATDIWRISQEFVGVIQRR